MIVNYIYKKENHYHDFYANGSRIELREYQKDLLFYSPLDKYKAEFALYDYIAKYNNKPVTYSGGRFGSYLKVDDYLKFDGNNIQPLAENGRISFYLGTNKINGKPSVSLVKPKTFPEEGLEKGEYSINVTVQDYPSATIVIDVDEGDSFEDLKNKFLFNLDPIIYRIELDTKSTDNNKIILNSTSESKTLKLEEGTQGKNLLDYVDIENTDYATYPEKDITIFEIGNFKINHIAKSIENKKYSYLEFIISDGENEQAFEVPWNNDPSKLDNIEVDFDKQVIYIFINGILTKIDLLNVVRTSSDSDLLFRGFKDAPYSFDELIINNNIIHRKSFELAKTQLTKYNTENPFIDFHFAGNELKDGMELFINEQYGCHACICDNDRYYYYNASSWRQGDGEYEKTNDFATFQNQLKDFKFSGKDFFIRVFFNSNGTELSYIDGLYFKINDEEYEDNEGNTAAILIGEKEWQYEDSSGDSSGEGIEETVDLIDTTLIITTADGTTTIPFTLEDYYKDDSFSSELYELKLTLKEVIDYINSYYPDGISKALSDSKNRAVLISEKKGGDAFITISGDAAPLIFGNIKSAQGEDAKTGKIDYTDFYNSVKEYIGDPLLAAEVTQEQLDLYLKEAIVYYKRYNDELNSYTCQLEGNWQDGFKIPSIIENQKDIVDILFRPIFPMKFYGEGLIDSQEDIVTLTMANYLFGSGSGGAHLSGGIAQDWYISLMSLQDFKQTLGLNPKWEILNNKIYIYPANIARYTKVAIKYKAPISLERALSEPEIRQYVAGKALCVMAEIENKYGGTLSSGSVQLHFAADSMYQHGQTLINQALEYWKKTQPVLGFSFG